MANRKKTETDDATGPAADPLPDTRESQDPDIAAPDAETPDPEPVPPGSGTVPDTGSEDTEAGSAGPPADDAAADPDGRPETITAAGAAQAETVVERRGGFGAAVLGGVAAAALGFIAGKSEILDPLLPPSWQSGDLQPAVDELAAGLAAQSQALAELKQQTDSISIPDISGLESQLTELAATIAPISGQIAELSSSAGAIDARLIEVEKRPITDGVSQSAIDAYERELARLRDAVTAQRSDVEQMVAEARSLDSSAAEAAQRAAIRSAIARLRTGLDNGAPIAAETDELRQAGVAIPPALAEVPAEGVATLTALQTSFAPAARDALAGARDAGAGTERGLGAFLQRQLGARSVEPRSGGDADAVLSRAESALINGKLDETLTELAALPEPAQPAMQNWMARAQARQAALDAADALASDSAQ